MTSAGDTWYIKPDDGVPAFGPISLDELKKWASSGRINHTAMISSDNQDWFIAPKLECLSMQWCVTLPDGTENGPLHEDAISTLKKQGELEAQTAIRNIFTGQETTIGETFGFLKNKKEIGLNCNQRLITSQPPKKRKYGNMWSKVLFVIVFMAMGIWSEYTFGVFMVRAKDSKNWPKVVGVVEGVGLRANGNTIRYKYYVDSKEYICRRYTYKTLSPRNLTSWQKGKKVTVYYNPQNPRDAVLKPGFAPYIALPIIVFLIFIVMPVVMFVRELRIRNKNMRE